MNGCVTATVSIALFTTPAIRSVIAGRLPRRDVQHRDAGAALEVLHANATTCRCRKRA